MLFKYFLTRLLLHVVNFHILLSMLFQFVITAWYLKHKPIWRNICKFTVVENRTQTKGDFEKLIIHFYSFCVFFDFLSVLRLLHWSSSTDLDWLSNDILRNFAFAIVICIIYCCFRNIWLCNIAPMFCLAQHLYNKQIN